MLMAPDNQVEKIWDERLWDKTCWTTLGSILMQHQDMEPLPEKMDKKTEPNKSHCPPALLGQRQLKLNFILPEQSVQSLIFHMGKPIKRHLRSLYSYSLNEILLGNKLPPGLSPSSKALAAP